LKLSLSANHLETLLLIFSFVFGLYDNFKEINARWFEEVEDSLPRQSIYPVLFLIAAILIITIIVSTVRIFFTFYGFRAVHSSNGFQIKSGLLNVKERLIHFPKIQFVSWKANWIRKKLQLWMMEYHISGADEMQKKSRVQLPLTRDEFIPLLADAYYQMPAITNEKSIQIHPSFFWRRLLIIGLLPSFIIIPLLWLIGQEKALFFLIYPFIIGSIAYLTQKKFRLWALQDVAFIKKGWLGETRILFRWHKLQSVQLRQSLFQKQRGLASVHIQTAAGSINIPFIALEAAQQVCNYALYKCESEKHSWM
jgi:putative membrane protein